MAQKVDYAALKKGGYMRQKQKGYGSLRLAVVGGNLTGFCYRDWKNLRTYGIIKTEKINIATGEIQNEKHCFKMCIRDSIRIPQPSREIPYLQILHKPLWCLC